MLKSVKHYLVPYRIQNSHHLPPALIGSLMYHTRAQLCIVYHTRAHTRAHVSDDLLVESFREFKQGMNFNAIFVFKKVR